MEEMLLCGMLKSTFPKASNSPGLYKMPLLLLPMPLTPKANLILRILRKNNYGMPLAQPGINSLFVIEEAPKSSDTNLRLSEGINLEI